MTKPKTQYEIAEEKAKKEYNKYISKVSKWLLLDYDCETCGFSKQFYFSENETDGVDDVLQKRFQASVRWCRKKYCEPPHHCCEHWKSLENVKEIK